MERFEEYLSSIDNDAKRTRLREVLSWVESTFPCLEGKIAWNQPMFTDHGTFIIGFSASSQHFSVSPEGNGIAVFSEAIEKSGYSHGTKLFRIKWSDAVDFSLLEEFIRYQMEDKKDCNTFWR